MPINRFTRPSNLGPGGNPEFYQLRWDRNPIRYRTQRVWRSKSAELVKWMTQLKASGVHMLEWEQKFVDTIIEMGRTNRPLWHHHRNLALEIIRKYGYKTK